MSAFGRALRYLGLSSGGDSERFELSRAADGREGALVGSRLSFRGEVTGDGDFYIAGRFEGDISVTGRVVVSEGAEVDANISGAAIVVGGTVRGNLSAATRVEILPSGVLTGSLKTGSFMASDGASVKGEVWVEPSGSRVSPVERKPQQP